MSAAAPPQPSSSPSHAIHVAIIGTAGRGPDGAKLNPALFQRMVSHVEYLLREVWKLPHDRVVLVSGGSAWADHVAVELFLRQAASPNGSSPYAGLQLFLPCALTTISSSTASPEISVTRAVDNGSWKWQINPGRLLNQVHDAFSKTMGQNTLDEITCAEKLGAQLNFDGHGFHARNKLVAKRADRMVAFTWNDDTTQPADGGTKHTWQLCKIAKERKIHVPLKSLADEMQHVPTLEPERTISVSTHSPSLLPPTSTASKDIDTERLKSSSRSKRKSNLAAAAIAESTDTLDLTDSLLLQPFKKMKPQENEL